MQLTFAPGGNSMMPRHVSLMQVNLFWLAERVPRSSIVAIASAMVAIGMSDADDCHRGAGPRRLRSLTLS
jgi:hypothetical protein